MDFHALKVLEFDKVCRFLESFAASAGGRRLCLQTHPQSDRAQVMQLQRETTEMRAELDEGGPLALGGVHDIRREVQRTRVQNFYLDQQQLVNIAETLETASTIKHYFSGLEESAPTLFRITGRIVPLPELTHRIRKSISPRGDILDNASPGLAEIRGRLRKLRQNIIRNLEKHFQDVDLSFAVQDDFITLRNNRFVIPVRSDRKNAIPGVVHDQSQSKATFFVEPMAVVELNNDLQLAQKEEYYEEIRILTMLTRKVRDYESVILDNLATLGQIDAIHARALLSRALGAVPPAISDDGSIVLKQCRHPILLARFEPDEAEAPPEAETAPEHKGVWRFDRPGIVPIELLKQPQTATMVITGANAGGKTVALKTLGLFVVMAQSGLHLPIAPEGSIAVYDRLFADIGDEQNIETSLSTFSAHMSQIKTIVTGATANSLVLLDELGSGTDPAEGGALAVAILDHLRNRRCTTMATTHLNLLKTYAYSNADVENVSVEFDPETNRPRYQLVYGLPGFSNALSIARNIGIPESILATATGYVDKADRQVAALIHGLEQSHKQLLAERAELEGMQEKAVRVSDACRRLLETMQRRKDRFLKTFEESARKLLRESEDTLHKIIKDQKRRPPGRPDDDAATDPRAQLQGIKQELYSRFPQRKRPEAGVERLSVGQRVVIVSLKKTGTVIAVDNTAQKAEIDIGVMRVKTGFQELCLEHAPKKPRPQAAPQAAAAPQPEPLREMQLNVIGMRVAEALPLVDKSIDTALMQGVQVLEIIHGRGTGRLMRAIHEHLQGHAQVARLSSGAEGRGGSGVTIVKIK